MKREDSFDTLIAYHTPDHEGFVRPGFDLDEDDSPVGIDHNQIDFAGFAGEVASESFEAFSFEELFAAFFAPSAEQFTVSQQLSLV